MLSVVCSRFDQLAWLPYMSRDKLWATHKKKLEQWWTLPAGHENAAQLISVNSIRVIHCHQVSLQSIVNVHREEEEEKEDSDSGISKGPAGGGFSQNMYEEEEGMAEIFYNLMGVV